jgi:hypothetical protein
MSEVMRAVVTEIESLRHNAEFISAIMAVRAALPSMQCPNVVCVLAEQDHPKQSDRSVSCGQSLPRAWRRRH